MVREQKDWGADPGEEGEKRQKGKVGGWGVSGRPVRWVEVLVPQEQRKNTHFLELLHPPTGRPRHLALQSRLYPEELSLENECNYLQSCVC